MLTKFVIWSHSHSLTISFVLFFVGSLISVYSSEIKGFLREYPKNRFREYVRNNSSRRLALLRRLHNNSYELVLFIAWKAVDGLWFAFYVQIGYDILTNTHASSSSSWSLLLGGLVGTGLGIRITLKDLCNYERSVESLSRLVGEVQPPQTVAASASTSP